MVRNNPRKTERASIPPEVLATAVEAVRVRGRTFRETSDEFGIRLRSLKRYCKAFDESGNFQAGYIKARQVFDDEQEAMLVAYLQKASDIYFGLAPKEVLL